MGREYHCAALGNIGWNCISIKRSGINSYRLRTLVVLIDHFRNSVHAAVPSIIENPGRMRRNVDQSIGWGEGSVAVVSRKLEEGSRWMARHCRHLGDEPRDKHRAPEGGGPHFGGHHSGCSRKAKQAPLRQYAGFRCSLHYSSHWLRSPDSWTELFHYLVIERVEGMCPMWDPMSLRMRRTDLHDIRLTQARGAGIVTPPFGEHNRTHVVLLTMGPMTTN